MKKIESLTVDDYVKAFKGLLAKSSKQQKENYEKLLSFVYNSPNYSATATEISKELNYVNYQGANSLNGNFSKRLCKEMSINPDNLKYNLSILYTWSHIPPKNECLLALREPVIKAIEKLGIVNPQEPITEKEFRDNLEKSVENSKRDTSKARQARLKTAPKKPEQKIVQSVQHKRNPDVIAEVLARADGICECCKKEAPFKTKKGEPYLEVHHKIPLAEDGDDIVENAEALCPNCHREKHYGIKYNDIK